MKQAMTSSDCGCGHRGEEPVTHQLQRVERLHHHSGLGVAILGLDSDAAQALAGEAQRLQPNRSSSNQTNNSLINLSSHPISEGKAKCA